MPITNLKLYGLGYLRPIATPILFLAILVSSYFLPFATIQYSMHAVSLGDIAQDKPNGGKPIPIQTKTISLDVMVYGVCGQQRKLKQIWVNREILLGAGNHYQQKQGADEIVPHNNRLQTLLQKTKLLEINRHLCADGDIINRDPLLATWVGAGLIVLVLFAVSGILSLLCITFHVITVIQNSIITSIRCDGRCQYRTKWIVDLLSEATSWFVVFASILYVALTWGERRSTDASLGSGCLAVLGISFAMFWETMYRKKWDSPAENRKRDTSLPAADTANVQKSSNIV